MLGRVEATMFVLCVLMTETTTGFLADTSPGMKTPTKPTHTQTATSPVTPTVHTTDSKQPTNNCTDSPVLDCSAVNKTKDVCSDISLAKPFCPHFCGFCDIVDGVWATWSVWSQCDRTCDNGTQVRTRTCTNPQPSTSHDNVPAGNPCVGDNRETQTCTRDLCPVHGSWGSWSVWGECSVTCSVGMQRRDRHCDDPYPSRNGDHCFGEGAAYRICFSGACADGDWSTWSAWGTCSATCNGGQMTRTRTCTNPTPSQFGRDCHGNYMDYKTCNARNCPATDGGWSTWSAWGTCSATCNGGQMTRTRTCTNPPPSQFSRDCSGNNMDYKMCNTRICSDQQIAFTAHTATENPTNNALTFSNVYLNLGGGYNQTTGKFKCPVADTYLFSATLISIRTRSGYTACWIRKNETTVVRVYSREGPLDSASVSTLVHLSVGDLVDVGDCFNVDLIYTLHEGLTSFTGSLIQAD